MRSTISRSSIPSLAIVALVALALAPAAPGADGVKSDRAGTERAPAPVKLAQRCFSDGGGVKCY